MYEAVFCIDFGSAFTKISLRRHPAAPSALVSPEGALFEYWVPTVVAMDKRAGSTRFEYGDKAIDITSGGNIHVFHDFKRHLFAEATRENQGPPSPPPAPIEALLNSDDFVALAARFQVPVAQLAALRRLAESARALYPNSATPVTNDSERQRNNAPILARHFFTWLRERVLAACARLEHRGLNYAELPVRVTVPALAPEAQLANHPGCRRLAEALSHARWPLHQDQPFISEPVSNALGVLTQATNALGRDGVSINLGRMLIASNHGSPLNLVLSKYNEKPSYRALVIDVGAYTTDFASLVIDTQGRAFPLSVENTFQVERHSIELAISNLDAEILSALPVASSQWLGAQPRSTILNLQPNIHDPTYPGFQVPDVGVIGGQADRAAIQPVLLSFGERLANALRDFCAKTSRASVQELILTGGGTCIPAIRKALIDGANNCAGPFNRVHAPRIEHNPLGEWPSFTELDTALARGGSALGGASIFFERHYH